MTRPLTRRQREARDTSAATFYHGGKSGLRVGDALVPSPPHVSDGCPICVAREQGRVYTVGEFRRWMRSIGGARAAEALAHVEGADDSEPLDPPSAQNAVYITTDRDYALWYAARSQGDLYRVAPVGTPAPSPEDLFPSYTVPRARVLEVVTRKVRLRDRERRRISRRWAALESDRRTPDTFVPLMEGES